MAQVFIGPKAHYVLTTGLAHRPGQLVVLASEVCWNWPNNNYVYRLHKIIALDMTKSVMSNAMILYFMFCCLITIL